MRVKSLIGTGVFSILWFCFSNLYASDIQHAIDAQAQASTADSPEVTWMAAPFYPTDAVRQGTEGHVVLEFSILPDGTTADIKVIESNPAEIFDAAAIRALEKTTYELVEYKLMGQIRKYTFEESN